MPGEKNFFQTFGEAFVKGDIFTKVSLLVWGLGYIGHGQLMKALLVTLVEGLGLYFLAFYGAPNLAKFGTLGTVKMEMVFDVTTMKNVVNNYVITMINSSAGISRLEGYDYISFIPYGGCVTGVTLTGFEYNVENRTFEIGDSLGVSNRVVSEDARIEIEDGYMIVNYSRD